MHAPLAGSKSNQAKIRRAQAAFGPTTAKACFLIFACIYCALFQLVVVFDLPDSHVWLIFYFFWWMFLESSLLYRKLAGNEATRNKHTAYTTILRYSPPRI